MSSIDLHIHDTLAWLTLNRPEKLNALTLDMIDQLDAHCATLESDTAVRVVLIKGAGAKAFCVGADIKAWSSLDALAFWRVWIQKGHRVFKRLALLPQPVIAVLNGYTFGGGLELALAADLRIAANHIQLALPEVQLGIIPGWAGTQRLPELIGVERAKRMIFTGDRIDAETGLSWGLLTEMVPGDQLITAAEKLAETIAGNAPLAVQLTKQTINAGQGVHTDAYLEALASGLAAFTEDAREGKASFAEKRKPMFKGK